VRRVRCKLGTQSVAIKKEHKGSAQEEGARIATNKTRWGKKNHTTKKKQGKKNANGQIAFRPALFVVFIICATADPSSSSTCH